jgi:hypothetical protein
MNARGFQRFGRGKRGEESLAVKRVSGVWLVETTLEIAGWTSAVTFETGTFGSVTFAGLTSRVRGILRATTLPSQIEAKRTLASIALVGLGPLLDHRITPATLDVNSNFDATRLRKIAIYMRTRWP